MRALNFNHLYYFYVVAREGSVAAASKLLHLTPQTISEQLRLLAEQLDTPLFRRVGRRLQLTAAGEMAYDYAERMFALGNELQTQLQRGSAQQLVLRVGLADVIPKTISYRLLAPALARDGGVRLICRENSLEELLAQLAVQRVDVVLADRPIGSATSIKAYSHLLGESGTSFMAAPALAGSLQGAFPGCLSGAPLLAPGAETFTRRMLDGWMDEVGLAPRIVAEFDDSALMKAFGMAGTGVFPVPSAIEGEVARQYDAVVVGRTDAVRERFYAVTADQRPSHPGFTAIQEAARGLLG